MSSIKILKKKLGCNRAWLTNILSNRLHRFSLLFCKTNCGRSFSAGCTVPYFQGIQWGSCYWCFLISGSAYNLCKDHCFSGTCMGPRAHKLMLFKTIFKAFHNLPYLSFFLTKWAAAKIRTKYKSQTMDSNAGFGSCILHTVEAINLGLICSNLRRHPNKP